jgi:glycosyltransferase involved in cell wall biosynthesis
MTVPTAIPDRKLLTLSLFDVPLPNGGVKDFLDNTDSLWDAIEEAGKTHNLPVVQVFTIRRERLNAQTITAMRGSVIFLFREKRPLRNLAWLIGLIRRAELVLLNNESWSDLFSAAVAQLCGARVVMYFHNADKVTSGKLPAWARRFFRSRLIDAGATSSAALKELFAPQVKTPLYVVPFGVDTDVFAYGERPPTPTLRVIFYGRISREKKIEDIVLGISSAQSRSRISFMVVGDEQDPSKPYTTCLRRLAETSGVAMTMCGHTPHSEMRQKLMEADVLVNMRPDEGFGKVFIEAMSTGLPVVGRRSSPGPSAIIRDGETGFLVDDTAQLGAVLDRLQADVSLRTRLGANAHEFVMGTYTLSHVREAAESLFATLLRDTSHGSSRQ